MTLEKAKKILQLHNYKEARDGGFTFEIVGRSIVARTPYTFQGGAGIEANYITFENGKTHIDGQRMNIFEFLGY